MRDGPSATEIRNMLADRTEAVVDELMAVASWSKGRGDWRCGDKYGNAGTSFRLITKGPDRGTWRDFKEGVGGSLIDLIMHVDDCDVASAFKWARQFLGLDGHLDPEEVERRRAKAEEAAERRSREAAIEREKAWRKVDRMWKSAKPCGGTLGEAYFREARRISVPACCRYAEVDYWTPPVRHDRAPVHVGRFPCIVTPVVTPERKIQTLHLTYFDLDRPEGKLVLRHPDSGRVLPRKKFVSPPSNAWIRLTPARRDMLMGEGMENTQSVLDRLPHFGGWVGGSVSQLLLVRFPRIVRRLIIIGDGDSSPARDADGNPVYKPDGSLLIPAEETTKRAAKIHANAGIATSIQWMPHSDASSILLAGGAA